VNRGFLEEIGLEAEVIDKILEAGNNELSKFKLNSAVERALELSRAKNFKAVSALLDMDKITLSEDGSVMGLKEQIDALKGDEGTGFLFDNDMAVKGALPGEKGVDDTKASDLDSMSYEQLCEHFN